MSSPSSRSVKIPENERGGWSSDRPRRPGEPERPPRRPDVAVRGRVLAPSESLRYSPGSLLLVVSADHGARDRFLASVIADQGTVFTLAKVRGLIAGRVPDGELEDKAQALLDAAAAKRLAAEQTVVIGLEGLDAGERERYVLLAAAQRRPRHLIFVEVGKDEVPEEDRAAVAELRTALDGGTLGAEGFATSLRLSGRTLTGLKRIVFAPRPADD